MKKLEIAKGKGRLYFDPETMFLRADYGGAGVCWQFERDEAIKLVASMVAGLSAMAPAAGVEPAGGEEGEEGLGGVNRPLRAQ